MMKKWIFLIFFVCFGMKESTAQEVFNSVLNNAEKIVNDPTSTFTNARICQFKCTVLHYMKKKAFETMPTVTERFLNVQAYYMSEFLSLFFKEILTNKKSTEEEKKARIMMFMDASCSNPLFDDPDKETVHSYITEGNELTPFSIDTDWEKAYAAATDQLKNKKK